MDQNRLIIEWNRSSLGLTVESGIETADKHKHTCLHTTGGWWQIIYIYIYIYVYIYIYITPFSLQFHDIQLVVTDLSHRCNSRTESGGEVREPCVLPKHDPAQPYCFLTEVSVHAPDPPQGVTRARWDKDIPAGFYVFDAIPFTLFQTLLCTDRCHRQKQHTSIFTEGFH